MMMYKHFLEVARKFLPLPTLQKYLKDNSIWSRQSEIVTIKELVK